MISRWHQLRSAYSGVVGRAPSSTTSSAPMTFRPGGAAVGDPIARRRRDFIDPRHRSNNRSSSSSSASSSSSSSSSSFARSEYVHPLSQIVLERLQSRHGDWVRRVGLNTGLRLNVDGTFSLRFPPPRGTDLGDATEAADVDSVGGGSAVNDAGGSIWTVYEPDEKRHYLCVTKSGLVGRYMLQDNKKPAWHTDKRSTPERVQDAVDEMIAKFNEIR